MAILRVGIVAEGKSDWLALEAIVRSVHPDVEFERLRPDMTLSSRSPHGWRGVKAWCQEHGTRLTVLMQGVVGRPLHLLVIHADCSMAHNEKADRPCPPAQATADALRDVITRAWLGFQSLPRIVVLATPALTTDSWVIAALDPPYRGKGPLECDERVERELVARGLLRKKDGEVKKPEGRYKPLVQEMIRNFERVRLYCSEAERFYAEVSAATLALPVP